MAGGRVNGWGPMETQTTCRGWCPVMVEHGMELGGINTMPRAVAGS